jgi:hypothetical protein
MNPPLPSPFSLYFSPLAVFVPLELPQVSRIVRRRGL